MSWRPPALVFPDIEQVLTAGIRAALTGRTEAHAQNVYVSNKTPNPRRDRMVIVRRDGGPVTATRDQPRVGINVWATSEQHATALAALVVAILRSLPDGAPILAVPYISGASPVADESEQPLRYFTAELHTRGVSL